MRRIIDAHVHIDKAVFDGEPDPSKLPRFVVSVDELVEHMAAQNVERAVIQQHPEAAINAAVSAAVRSYPGRFRGAMILPLDDERCVEAMEQNYADGLTILKLEMFGSIRLYPHLRLDSPVMQRIYARAQQLGVVIAVDPFRTGEPGYQPEALERAVRAYPELRFVICHLGYCRADLLTQKTHRAQWDRMASLGIYDNVWFDASAMPDMFSPVESYPYDRAMRFVREFINVHGPRKVLWGSDILGELGMGTYREFIDMFAQSTLFSDDEKDLIFFGNADHVYFDA